MLKTHPLRLRDRHPRGRWIGGKAVLLRALTALASVGVYALLVVRPVLTSDPGPLGSLRTAYWYDQLGYLAIVSDAAAGELDPVEPMTMTGVNHYPRNYYVLVGMISRALSVEPVVAWNATSIALQFSAIVSLSLVLAMLSGRWWVGALAPAPFLTGTLSVVTNDGAWYRPLDSHAVLWGPYGALFSNNAETSALCLIIVVLASLSAVWLRPVSRWWRVGVSLGGAVVLGALSGFQTYSFLTGTYLVAAVIAAIALSRSQWWWSAASGLAMAVVLITGPSVAEAGGQLATLVYGLLPLLPGLVRGVVITRGALLLYGGAMAIAAAPPILWTLSGVLGGDPFLTYRTGSNVGLGIIHPQTLIASAPMLIVCAGLIWVSIRARDRTSSAAMIGASVISVYLSINDVWGANAEPYRFWTNCLLITGAVAVLVTARLIGLLATARDETEASEQTVDRRRSHAGLALLAVAGLIYAVSLADVVAFAGDERMGATWNPAADREQAIAAAADRTLEFDELVVTDACIDPSTTKVLAPAAIAHYYLGMAWPSSVESVSAVMAARSAGTLNASVVQAAEVGWLLRDSACATPLMLDGVRGDQVGSFEYGGGSISILRLEAL